LVATDTANREVMMNLADQEVPAATTELAGLVSKKLKLKYYLIFEGQD